MWYVTLEHFLKRKMSLRSASLILVPYLCKMLTYQDWSWLSNFIIAVVTSQKSCCLVNSWGKSIVDAFWSWKKPNISGPYRKEWMFWKKLIYFMINRALYIFILFLYYCIFSTSIICTIFNSKREYICVCKCVLFMKLKWKNWF